MTAETKLRNDDVRALSGCTENTVIFKEQIKALRKTAVLYAQHIRDLEVAQKAD